MKPLLLFTLIFLLSACTRPASGPVVATALDGPAAQASQAGQATPTMSSPAAASTATEATAGETAAAETPMVEAAVVEVAVIEIPLAGEAGKPEAELSGMAWYSDTLILLPQYPTRCGAGDGCLWGLAKADILAFLDGSRREPLQPFPIRLLAPGANKLKGFEGFEALAFAGDQVFVTIETKPGKMLGCLVSGSITPDGSQISLDTAHATAIEPQSGITNLSDEALLVAGRRVFTFYEANGARVNPKPVAHLFDLTLAAQGTVTFPALEYRLTDVTPPDERGSFWGINYFYPGDSQLAAPDPLARQYGIGESHARSPMVERLVEFHFTENGVELSAGAPLQLQLTDEARNWEAIARLDERGFLLATDKFPRTILGFAAYP